MPFTQVDLLTDSQGDLVVDSNGDLKLATEAEVIANDISFRLRTEHLDYGPSPFLSANLASLYGEPNNRRTGDLAKELVYTSLVQDRRVPSSALFVDVVPTSAETLQVFVIVSDRVGTETTPTVVTYTLELLPKSPAEESILEVGA